MTVFTARCYASAVLAMALRPSVRPSVCPSQVGVCKDSRIQIKHVLFSLLILFTQLIIEEE